MKSKSTKKDSNSKVKQETTPLEEEEEYSWDSDFD